MLDDAFAALVDAIRATGDHVGSGDDRAEGYAYGTELIRAALDLYADGDGDAPRFVPFSTPLPYHAGALAVDRVQGGVNPDGLYDFAVLRSDRSYRISGRRGNDCYLSLSFSGGKDGEWPDRTVTTRNDRQLSFGRDGSFEVVVSPDERAGNWVRMEPDICSLIVRQYFDEPPSRRTPATLAIEALDGHGGKPLLTEEIVARRLVAAAAFIRSTNDHWPFPPGLLDNAFSDPLGYSGEAGALGTTDNTYCMGRWQLAPGDKLVIETTPIACGYWSVQAWNRWGQSIGHAFDDENHQRQVVNHRTATMNTDGSVRVVLAHADPGEPNWLETGGFTEGSLIFRFLYPDAKPERPRTEVVRQSGE
jgi:hypothetical protein